MLYATILYALCSMLCSMQAFMRSRRCWFSDIVSQGTISRVCPFKLAARTLSLVKQMEYLRHREKIIIHTNQVNSLEVYSARTLNPLRIIVALRLRASKSCTLYLEKMTVYSALNVTVQNQEIQKNISQILKI